MGLKDIQEEVGGGIIELAVGAWWSGAREAHQQENMGDASAQSDLYVLLHQQKAKYQELKDNAECLHIETGSPISTDEQLMFEATSGSNKGHVYGFGSHSSLSLVPLVSSVAVYESCVEREEIIGIHAAGTGQVRPLYDLIHLALWSVAGFGTHCLPFFPAVG
ncbi:hypothetical protein M9H77_08748 [Catharanthus roseus]|uniref:Uncharacterized protein n=1 Tax=Catharanthus roseus TaxID=4058 RepID=A0ACC0BYM0_CATRO|nr:hypothetical protein M9H77_08748 [Catharanthus roseus]